MKKAILFATIVTLVWSCQTTEKQNTDVAHDFFYNTVKDSLYLDFLAQFSPATLPYQIASYATDFQESIITGGKLTEIPKKYAEKFLELVEVSSQNGPSYTSMLAYYTNPDNPDNNPHYYYGSHFDTDSLFITLSFIYTFRTDANEDITGTVLATFDQFGNPITAILLSYHYQFNQQLSITMYSDAEVKTDLSIQVKTTTFSRKADDASDSGFREMIDERYQTDKKGKITAIK